MSCAALPTKNAADVALPVLQDVEWQVVPEWRDALLGPDGLRWEEWRRQGFVRVVKHGAHRTVYRVELPDRAFYLKHYHPERSSALLANWLRGSAARREWRNALEVHRRGLPTATPVALGEVRRGRRSRESYFLSQAIAQSTTLEEFAQRAMDDVPPARRSGVRRRIVVALAGLCAAAHRAGVDHADLHAGNVLVALQTIGGDRDATSLPNLYWIDLPAMRFSGPLDWPRSCRSLAMLAAGWLARTTRSEQWRFWKAYMAGRPDLVLANESSAATELHRRARLHAQQTMAGRDKRALATNRDFYRLVDSQRIAYAVRDLAPDDLAAWIGACGDLSGERRGDLCVAGSLRPVVQIGYPWRGWRDSVASTGEAFRAWRLAHALLAREIPTPRPLCVWQPRRRGDRSPAYLVTEALDGTPLDERACQWTDRAGARPVRGAADCAAAVGRLLGHLHAWNFTFPTPGASAVTMREAAATAQACLNQLVGVRLVGRFSTRRRTRELADFSDSLIVYRVSNTDRLRCLRSYLRSAQLPISGWKELWRRVEAVSVVGEIARGRQAINSRTTFPATSVRRKSRPA